MSDLNWPGHTVRLSPAEQFFFDNAGFSCDLAHESAISGQTRGAILLAAAEDTAKRKRWTVEWSIDPDAETTPGPGYFVSGAPHWMATLWSADPGEGDADVLASLGSIDFGFDTGGHAIQPGPGTPYARVIEAEMALEAIG
jgi:hypothetical protein